jgi:hypothetical protein
MYKEGEADDARYLELDLAEEVRCNALLQSALYLQGVCCYHDRNVQKPQWPGGPKLLEYQAPTPILPLANLYPMLSAAAQHI